MLPAVTVPVPVGPLQVDERILRNSSKSQIPNKESCEIEKGSKESLLVGLVGVGDKKVMPQHRDHRNLRLCIRRHPTWLVAYGEQRTGRDRATTGHCWLASTVIHATGCFTKRPVVYYDRTKLRREIDHMMQPLVGNGFSKMANKFLKRMFDEASTLTGC